MNDAALVIRFGAQQLPARGTFPEIHFWKINEPGVSIALRAFDENGAPGTQGPNAAATKKIAYPTARRTSMWTPDNHASDLFDSTISVNNTALGASRVV